MPENTKKEKFLAVGTVIFLFIFVGGLLFLVSLSNKHKVEALNAAVSQIKIENEEKLALVNIFLATSSAPALTAKSFLTLAVTEHGLEKSFGSENPDLVLPIASITKLMLGVIILENVDLETEVKATTDYIGLEESAFILETGKIYKVRDLLANTLISSDNDSARLLASTLGENNFVSKMNQKAKSLGLTNTYFAGVTGLDPAVTDSGINVSTVTDLANLLIYIKERHPEIFSLTANSQYNFCDINNFCKLVSSTNKLLADGDLKYKIVGGKTGSTDLAGKNLVLITEPLSGIMLINIVLGSEDSFLDMRALINQIEINK